jgi:hypothetical protein
MDIHRAPCRRRRRENRVRMHCSRHAQNRRRGCRIRGSGEIRVPRTPERHHRPNPLAAPALDRLPAIPARSHTGACAPGGAVGRARWCRVAPWRLPSLRSYVATHCDGARSLGYSVDRLTRATVSAAVRYRCDGDNRFATAWRPGPASDLLIPALARGTGAVYPPIGRLSAMRNMFVRRHCWTRLILEGPGKERLCCLFSRVAYRTRARAAIPKLAR